MVLVGSLDVLHLLFELLVLILQLLVEVVKVILYFLGGGLDSTLPLITAEVVRVLSNHQVTLVTFGLAEIIKET
jgi:hypothetical protein